MCFSLVQMRSQMDCGNMRADSRGEKSRIAPTCEALTFDRTFSWCCIYHGNAEFEAVDLCKVVERVRQCTATVWNTLDCSGACPWIILIFGLEEVATKPRVSLCQRGWNGLSFSHKTIALKIWNMWAAPGVCIVSIVSNWTGKQKIKTVLPFFGLALVRSFPLSAGEWERSHATTNKRISCNIQQRRYLLLKWYEINSLHPIPGVQWIQTETGLEILDNKIMRVDNLHVVVTARQPLTGFGSFFGGALQHNGILIVPRLGHVCAWRWQCAAALQCSGVRGCFHSLIQGPCL